MEPTKTGAAENVARIETQQTRSTLPMKFKSKRIPNRLKFDSDWEQVDYCYRKILYWFYARHSRSRAQKFCQRLESLLRKVDRRHESIKGEECWSLLCEVRGQLDKAIFYRRSEIRLIRKLQRFKPSFEHYGPDDLADRLELLGTLYKEADDIQQAIKALRDAKRICSRNGIRFDSPDLLREYESEMRARRISSPAAHRGRT